MKKEYKQSAWIIYPYRMLPGAILEFYDSLTMYLGLTHSIRKNKEKDDLEFFIFIAC